VRIALLGGSFDPVHFGHLSIADDAASRLGYDSVIFVPAYVSPHKKGVDMASPDDRTAMLNAAIRNDRRFSVDDCELRRSGVSYTMDTIDDMERRYRPKGKFGLIIGEDLIAGFPTWHDVDALVSRVDLVLAARPGFSASFPYPHRRLENPPLNVSSSEIRRRIAQGLSWRYLVPDSVRQRVEERGLYGFAANPRSPERDTAEAVEDYAARTLSRSRYLHSRGVALLAASLCARFGLDPDAGYLAGIAHDICKELSPDAITSLALLDGKPVSEVEGRKPALLHARAAACFLESRFSYRDERVLEAIRLHTFGASGMGELAKIVYVADKIEPSRESVSPPLREMTATADLDELFSATVTDTVRYLRERGKTVSEQTERLLAECRRRDGEDDPR
jgi:nicotinate-nucleotide adenylyltransferase